MKKLLVVFLSLCLALGSASFALAEDAPIVIDYYMGLGGILGDCFGQIVDDYNASQSNVHVNFVQFADFGATQEGYQAALAAGKPVAVWQSQQRRWSAFEDYLAPLNEFYKDPEFNVADFSAGSLDCCYGSDGETIYGIPVYASTHVMYYRPDVFAGYDIEKVFSSWQNLAEVCYEIVAADNGVKYGMEPMWQCETWINAVYSASGLGIYTDATQKEVNFMSDAWIDVMTSFRKWMVEDKIMTMHTGGTGWEYWYACIDDVLDGTAGGYTGSPADMGDLDFSKVACIQTPGWNGNTPSCVGEAHTLVISKGISDEEKAAAFDFCKFLCSPKNQAQITMIGGYLPTRASTLEEPALIEYMKTCPAVAEATAQLNVSRHPEVDITGGYITTAMNDMLDNILINEMDVVEALTQCQEEAQAALDEYWAEQ